jgi:hypothetical protein
MNAREWLICRDIARLLDGDCMYQIDGYGAD